MAAHSLSDYLAPPPPLPTLPKKKNRDEKRKLFRWWRQVGPSGEAFWAVQILPTPPPRISHSQLTPQETNKETHTIDAQKTGKPTVEIHQNRAKIERSDKPLPPKKTKEIYSNPLGFPVQWHPTCTIR